MRLNSIFFALIDILTFPPLLPNPAIPGSPIPIPMSSRGVPGPFAGELFISILSPFIILPDPPLLPPFPPPGPPPDPGPPGGPPLGPPGPIEPMLPSEVLHISPDIVEAGFIIVYIDSPDDVFESWGLGIMGVLDPGGGPPGGPPYPPGDIPGAEDGGQGGRPPGPIGGIGPGGGGPLIGPYIGPGPIGPGPLGGVIPRGPPIQEGGPPGGPPGIIGPPG